MTTKTIVVAACALSALFASGAAKWNNLDDKSHVSGPKLTEADLLGKAVLVYYWDASVPDSLKKKVPSFRPFVANGLPQTNF